jgi:prepilin-type processing-associated H-X9-DG protein
LPYIEEGALAEGLWIYLKSYNATSNPSVSALNYLPTLTTVISPAMCPSELLSPKQRTLGAALAPLGSSPQNPGQGFHGNYVGCASTGFFNAADPDGTAAQQARYQGKSAVQIARDLDGTFFVLSKVRHKEITDGNSHTLLFSELILAADQAFSDVRGRYHNGAHGNVFFSTKYPPNSSVPDTLSFCSQDVTPPEAPCITISNRDNPIRLGARSYHTGGVNACRADGSVEFISDEVDAQVFKAMGSIDGGESL